MNPAQRTRSDHVGPPEELLALINGAVTFVGVAFPPNEHGSLALLPRIGADRAIEVITFKTDFRPSGFDRPVTEHFKDQILSKLARAGIATLTVIIKRGPRRELVLHFHGVDEDIAKADAAFNINRETPTNPLPDRSRH
jgi:hypothetical protein